MIREKNRLLLLAGVTVFSFTVTIRCHGREEQALITADQRDHNPFPVVVGEGAQNLRERMQQDRTTEEVGGLLAAFPLWDWRPEERRVTVNLEDMTSCKRVS